MDSIAFEKIEYTPHDWFWIVGGDLDRAWSSAADGYVPDWPAQRTTRIPSEIELSEVLRVHGIRGPVALADDVRAECARRMAALVGARSPEHLAVIVSNGSREAIRLLRIRADRAWTPEEATRAATLEAIEAEIERLRSVSNSLEPNPPTDYADDKYWSRAG